MSHVSSRSGVATLRTAIHLLLAYSTVGLCRLVCLSVEENRTRPPSWLLLHSALSDLESLMLSTNAGMTGV